MNPKYFTILLLTGILSFSCKRTKPQLPSNKIYATDSVSKALTQINNSLIEKEDSILTEFVAKNYPDFTKSESGFWYLSDCKNEKKCFKLHEKCTLDVKIFNLDGNLLIDEKQTIHIGRKETINGIEEAIKLFSKGCKIQVVLPWYLAYGSKGKLPEIPPFTSVYAVINTLE